MKRHVLFVATILLSACAAPSAGTRWEDVPTDPETWVDARLAPGLARRLADHPRFAGTTLAVGLPGQLDRVPSGLERRLDETLESRLLHAEGLRLRASARDSCPAVDTDYRLGFVVSDSGDEHRVELRVFETASGEWVTGLADSWQGPLSRRDRADQATPAGSRRPGGSPAVAFAPEETELAAEALAQALSCELVAARLAPGPIESGADPLAAPTAQYLRTLGHARSAAAGWRLDIRRTAEAGAEQVVARLASPEGMVSARTYLATRPGVASAPAARPPPATTPAARTPSDPVPARPGLRAADCGARCFGVSMAPGGHAVLLAVIPGRGLTSTRRCPARVDAAGRRITTLPGQDAGWARFYALKGHGHAADALERLEARLPSACGAGVLPREGAWLAELQHLTTQPGHGVAWSSLTVDATTRGARP